MMAAEEKPKRHYPALILGILGTLIVPGVKWLVTKELGPVDFVVAAVPVVMGALTHTQVTPVKDMVPAIAEKVGEATILVAQKLDATAAGPPGKVTEVATQVAADVTSDVAKVRPTLADTIVKRTKARVGL
jgi:hypothetical protein